MPSNSSLALHSRRPLAGLALLLLLAIFIPGRIWTTLLVGLGGLMLIAYVWARQLAQHVHASRRLRFGWVAVGDRLSEQFTLKSDSLLPAFWVEIFDESNVPGYEVGVVRSLGAQQSVSWRQSAVCERRGQYRLGPWALLTGDPFGIFQVTIRYVAEQEVIIHPPVDTQLPIPLPAGRSSGRTRARLRSWQATVNAAAVREYQTSDPLRWIHWPSSAHHNRLLVRQFDLDAAGDIWLVPDLHSDVQLGSGADSTVEQAILTAAALGAQALRQNRGVGLACYGQEPRLLLPSHGEGQQWRLLRALALVEADGDTPLKRALSDLSDIARRGSAAVIISPSGSPAWLPSLLQLSQRGVQCHIILLERGSFGGDSSTPALHETLRRSGFDCDVLRKGDLRRAEGERERRGFWEFKTTPSGKVVVVSQPDILEG